MSTNEQRIDKRERRRGMYVSPMSEKIGKYYTLPTEFRNIFSCTDKTAALLAFIVKYQFNSIAVYNLSKILKIPSLCSTLSKFIEDARRRGVDEFNAVGGSEADFEEIAAYQNNSSYAGKFDGVAIEYEFWRKEESEITAEFNKTISMAKKIRDLNIQNNNIRVKTSLYIGRLKSVPKTPDATAAAAAVAAAAKEIASNVDRVFIHCYVLDPKAAFNYGKDRIQEFINAGKPIEFCPMFSSEGLKHFADKAFMGDWLAKNSLDIAERIFQTSYEAQYKSSSAILKFSGFMYYEYAFLVEYLKSEAD